MGLGMKIKILIFFLANALRAMDVASWTSDMRSAVTLLQGTSRDGYIDIARIKEIASLIKDAKKQRPDIANLHNSPLHLLIPAVVSADQLFQIGNFLNKHYQANYYSKTDDFETRYSFEKPQTDVIWISHIIDNKWKITTRVKSLFSPKIELGCAGSETVSLRFINHEGNVCIFTFKKNELIGDGND